MTGKSYPTASQVGSLARLTRLRTHLPLLPNGDRVLLLGCFDLALFNNRVSSRVSRSYWRYWAIRRMRGLAARFPPNVVLQHPHETDSPDTWRGGWRCIQQNVGSIGTSGPFAAAGRWANSQLGSPRAALNECLDATAQGQVMTAVVS